MSSGTTGGNKAASRTKTKQPVTGKSAGKAAAARSSTRTAARSAKRRSPKASAADDDGELLEVERVEFLKAMDKYKRQTGQTFPSWSEVLSVLRSIGWISPMRLAERQAKQG
ncbi:MAG: hypothetical protein DRQ55_08270 [Planctomycetota bacterium]|nr:MAG: hypothetical protein DRQ55_08270 [Planctomycetota bacterium]